MSEPTSPGGSRRAAPTAQAVEALGRHLEAEGWAPQRLAGRDSFVMSYAGASGVLTCYAHLLAEADQLICYAEAPLRVPPERLAAAAEFVVRASFGLYHGNLELDLDDGELRSKCSLDFEGDRLSASLVRNTILPAARIMEAYLPGLRLVLAGAEPRAAVEQVEAAG